MKLAILGATSQIAKDLIVRLLLNDKNCVLHLYSRNSEKIKTWMDEYNNLHHSSVYYSLNDFNFDFDYDGIINFIGVSDPAKMALMGNGILDITQKYDSLIMDYLHRNINCKYIFISSGAAYGDVFSNENNPRTHSCFNVNGLNISDLYGLAKYYAESKHRSFQSLKIYDLRVFSYFSFSQDIESRLILSEMYRAIRDKSTFITSDETMVRDYIHPDDFYQLISRIFNNEINNCTLDCYSLMPINKIELIDLMHNEFGMKYIIENGVEHLTRIPSSKRIYYYSKNKLAGDLINYCPLYSSKDAILSEMTKMIECYKYNK